MTSRRPRETHRVSATRDSLWVQHPSGAQQSYGRRVPSQPTPHGQAFAELIRDARKAAGITQVELADRAGLARTTIARWESGAADRPGSEEVRIACRMLGIDPRRAAIALGLLTEEEVWSPAPPRLPAELEEVLEALQDPALTTEERSQWIEYLRFLRDRGRQRKTG